MKNHEIRTLVDNRNETIGKKIREAEVKKIPFMLIVGENEMQNDTVSVRKHGEGDLGTMAIEAFANLIHKEISVILKDF